MNYKIISSESAGESAEYIIIIRDDGSFESFPVDENNPRYIQWLAEQNEVTK